MALELLALLALEGKELLGLRAIAERLVAQEHQSLLADEARLPGGV
jgi:hypothetical protein